MTSKFKILLLILAIISLHVDIELAYNKYFTIARADSSTITHAGRASNPQCATGNLATYITTGVSVAFGLAVVGLFFQGSVATFAVGATLFTAGLILLTSFSADLLVCMYSFVRHPVKRSADGHYLKCKEPRFFTYTTEDGRKKQKRFCPPGSEWIKSSKKEESSIYYRENRLWTSSDNIETMINNAKKKYKTLSKDEKGDDTENDYIDRQNPVDLNWDGYVWPLNAVPKSDFIEVCRRQPMGSLRTGNSRFGFLDAREIDYKGASVGDRSNLTANKRNIAKSTLKCITLKEGDKKEINGAVYQAVVSGGGKLCVKLWGMGFKPAWPQPTIGCHLKETQPISPMCDKSVPTAYDPQGRPTAYDNSKCMSCYISSACYTDAGLYAKAQFPITSVVVQCLTASMAKILAGDCIDSVSGIRKEGFLIVAKKRLKTAVQAILLIAILMFGVKLMLGALQGPSEIFMFIIKMALVIYFAIGDGMPYYYTQLTKLSMGLADLVLSAGGNPTVCNFKSSDYVKPAIKSGITINDNERKWLRSILANSTNSTKGAILNKYTTVASIRDDKTKILHTLKSVYASKVYKKFEANFDQLLGKLEFRDYSYLALWDRLDCRLLFYLGKGIRSSGAGAMAIAVVPFGIFAIVIAALFSFQIILSIVTLIFIVLIIIVIIWIVYIFVLSLLALTLIALFAPIFVPMALFQVTKNFFDSWLKELIAYSLYPVVLFAFMALLFSVFDKLYFNDLQFAEKTIVKQGGVTNIKETHSFYLSPYAQCTDFSKYPQHQETLFCRLVDVNFLTKSWIFGTKVTSMNDNGKLWKSLGMMALMCFLFYHFLSVIGSLAAELTGSFRSDVSHAAFDPKAAAGKAASGLFGLGKKLKQKGSDKKKDKSSDNESDNKQDREGIKGNGDDSSSDSGESSSASDNESSSSSNSEQDK